MFTNTDRSHVAWDIETTGFSHDDRITAAGFWYPDRFADLLLNADGDGDEVDADRYRDRLEAASGGVSASVTVLDDEAALLHELRRVLFDRRFARFSDRDDIHKGDTHLRTVKQFGTPSDPQTTVGEFGATTDGDTAETPTEWRAVRDELSTAFDAAIDNIVGELESELDFDRPVAVALDSTPMPYYGGLDGMPMVNASKDSEKRYAYEIATITVVGENEPIILAIEPWKRDSGWDDGDGQSTVKIVRRLLDTAREKVDIRLLMADREFDSQHVLELVENMEIDYLIPKRKHTTEKERIRRMERAGREVSVTHG